VLNTGSKIRSKLKEAAKIDSTQTSTRLEERSMLVFLFAYGCLMLGCCLGWESSSRTRRRHLTQQAD